MFISKTVSFSKPPVQGYVSSFNPEKKIVSVSWIKIGNKSISFSKVVWKQSNYQANFMNFKIKCCIHTLNILLLVAIHIFQIVVLNASVVLLMIRTIYLWMYQHGAPISYLLVFNYSYQSTIICVLVSTLSQPSLVSQCVRDSNSLLNIKWPSYILI